MLEKSKHESKLADSRKTHSELVKKGFTMIGNLLRRYIATEMQATLNAATYDLWSSKCGIGTWDKMEGCTLAWIVSCYFAAGAEGKPHLEYKLRSMIMMTAGMQASTLILLFTHSYLSTIAITITFTIAIYHPVQFYLRAYRALSS